MPRGRGLLTRTVAPPTLETLFEAGQPPLPLLSASSSYRGMSSGKANCGIGMEHSRLWKPSLS